MYIFNILIEYLVVDKKWDGIVKDNPFAFRNFLREIYMQYK